AELQDGDERGARRAARGREDARRVPAAGARRPGPRVSRGGAPLAGKIALVTGASRGIGLAVANALHAAGAHVVRLARSLSDGGAERRTDLRCDVGDRAAVERAVARVVADPGAPDVVVNNAGIFFIKPVAETSPEEFARALTVSDPAPAARHHGDPADADGLYGARLNQCGMRSAECGVCGASRTYLATGWSPAITPHSAFRTPHFSPCWPWLHSAPPPPRRSRPCPTRPASACTCSRSRGRRTAPSGSGPTVRGSMSCGRARGPGSTAATTWTPPPTRSPGTSSRR